MPTMETPWERKRDWREERRGMLERQEPQVVDQNSTTTMGAGVGELEAVSVPGEGWDGRETGCPLSQEVTRRGGAVIPSSDSAPWAAAVQAVRTARASWRRRCMEGRLKHRGRQSQTVTTGAGSWQALGSGNEGATRPEPNLNHDDSHD
jgi:hypothetical protein